MPSRVPDAATLESHRISHLDSVYERAAERAEIHSPRAATSFCPSKNLHKTIESSSVYREGVSPSRVPDAATPKDSINLLENAVYERAAEAMGDLLTLPITSL